MLWMFQRVNYGPVSNEKNSRLPDLDRREWLVILPVVAAAVLMGVLPNLFLRPIEPSVQRMLTRVNQTSRTRIQASVGAPPLGPAWHPRVAQSRAVESGTPRPEAGR
jgi:NADH-quinone oxidoreductase subunit M